MPERDASKRKVDKVLKNYRGGGKQTPDEGDEEEED